jgi:hypothetical protein
MIYDLNNISNNTNNNFGGICKQILLYDWDLIPKDDAGWEADLFTGTIRRDDLPIYANNTDLKEITPAVDSVVYSTNSRNTDSGTLIEHEIQISLHGLSVQDRIVLHQFINKRLLVLFNTRDKDNSKQYILGDKYTGCTMSGSYTTGSNAMDNKEDVVNIQWISNGVALIVDPA